MRAETNRVLARRRANVTGNELANRLCDEALKAAVNEIIDRAVRRVLDDALNAATEEGPAPMRGDPLPFAPSCYDAEDGRP